MFVKEIWIKQALLVLMYGNEFMTHCIDESENVQANVVHRPIATHLPKVTKNRTVFPAAVKSVSDGETTYTIDRLYVEPFRIGNLDRVQTVYNLIDATLTNATAELRDRLALELLLLWEKALPSSNIIRTSGASTVASAPGATGNRKAVVEKDVREIARVMDNMKVPQTGRKLLMQPDMYYSLYGDDSIKRADAYGSPNLPSGVVQRLYGFDIMVRGGLPSFTNDGTPQVRTLNQDGVAASGTSDNLASLAWHPNFVAKAMGAINMYQTQNSAENYGDLYSMDVLFGGQRIRPDATGVVALVQAAA